MSTQIYLLGGLQEGRVPSDRDLRQRREARQQRRLSHPGRRHFLRRR